MWLLLLLCFALQLLWLLVLFLCCCSPWWDRLLLLPLLLLLLLIALWLILLMLLRMLLRLSWTDDLEVDLGFGVQFAGVEYQQVRRRAAGQESFIDALGAASTGRQGGDPAPRQADDQRQPQPGPPAMAKLGSEATQDRGHLTIVAPPPRRGNRATTPIPVGSARRSRGTT